MNQLIHRLATVPLCALTFLLGALAVGPSSAEAQAAPEPAPPDHRWLAELHAQVEGAVVAVTSASDFAAGFLIYSGRHVLTTFEVVRLGRPVDVHFSNGDVTRASVVAVDEDADLALLELDADAQAGSAPLALADTEVAVGDVVAVVLPVWLSYGEDDTAWFSAPSIVGSTSGRRVLVPAAFQAPWTERGPAGAYGAPLLSPDGSVVAIVTDADEGIVVAARVERARALVERYESGAESYSGEWTVHFRLGWTVLFELGLIDDDVDAPNGVLLGISVQARDRWLIELRFSPLFIDPTARDPGVSREVQGSVLELLFGYRVLLTDSDSPVPLYLTPRLGASLTQIDRTERRLAIVEGALEVVKTVDEGDVLVHPTVQLGFGITRFVELGVGFHANVEAFDESAFTGFIALGF